MTKIRIIAKVARPSMLDNITYLNLAITDRIDLRETKKMILWQMREGNALIIQAHVSTKKELHKIYPLCLAGLVTSDDDGGEEAQVWFHPTIHMPRFAKTMLRELPRFIRGLMLVGGYKRALTLIEADNKKFKKFAKLCKFDYSSKLVINGIKFEEWKFGGADG